MNNRSDQQAVNFVKFKNHLTQFKHIITFNNNNNTRVLLAYRDKINYLS